jgi:hypothetical protein
MTDKPMPLGEIKEDRPQNKHEFLRDNLMLLYGRMQALHEMQSHIQKEILETVKEISETKSLLKGIENDR